MVGRVRQTKNGTCCETIGTRERPIKIHRVNEASVPPSREKSRSQPRLARTPDKQATAPPVTLWDHPIIAVSLILMLAACVQVGVWFASTQLPAPTTRDPSCVTVHGLLFDLVRHITSQYTLVEDANQPVFFAGCLIVALLSGIAWYAVARVALGPRWGLWTGLCWVAYPPFAFLAQRPGPLTLMMALVPLALWLVLAWRRSGNVATAVLLGIALAVMSLVSLQGVLLWLIVLSAMLLCRGEGAKRGFGLGFGFGFVSALLMVAGFVGTLSMAVPVAVPWMIDHVDDPNAAVVTGSEDIRRSTSTWQLLASGVGSMSDVEHAGSTWLPWKRMYTTWLGGHAFGQAVKTDLWFALDDGDGSVIAVAAGVEAAAAPPGQRPSGVRLLVGEFRRSPVAVLGWFLSRCGRTVYATSDGLVHHPLMVLQFALLAMAMWGGRVAMGKASWQWFTLLAIVIVAVIWSLAAIAEPLARNLAPIAGLGVIFALIGIADLYERLIRQR